MRAARDLRDAQDRAAAEQVASTLVPKVITMAARAGKRGQALRLDHEHRHRRRRRGPGRRHLDQQLRLDEPIKTTGTHTVPVKLHSDVEFPITLEVSGG